MNSEQWKSSLTELYRSDLFESSIGNISLSISELILPDGPLLKFIEDTSSRRCSIPEIVATNRGGREVYTSKDRGLTWQRRYRDIVFNGPIVNSFTTRKGERFLATDNPFSVYRFDREDNLTHVHSNSGYPWHGTQGIGESSDGTVMFGEYAKNCRADGVNSLRIMRYSPNDTNWEVALEVDAAFRPPDGLIRHFHICTTLANNPDRWIVTSGDACAHDRMYISENNGSDWREVYLRLDSGEIVLEKCNAPLAVRLTSLASLSNGSLIWGTDDELRIGKSALISAELNDTSLEMRLVTLLGNNCIRNIIKFSDDIFVLISESHHDTSKAEISLFDRKKNLLQINYLPNLQNKSSPVSVSISSLEFVEGIAFVPSRGEVLTPSIRGMFVLRIINN